MESSKSPSARIVRDIPLERVDLSCGGGKSVPVIGDIVRLDQGFAGPDAEAMGIVCCLNVDGSTRWCADVFDSEIELIGTR